MKHEYIRTHITAEPFSNPHVRKVIDGVIENALLGLRDEWTTGRVFSDTRPTFRVHGCDPFARESFTTQHNQGQKWITNDFNEMMPTLYHLEAHEFADLMLENQRMFDVLVFDPPYNLSQLKRQYEGIGKTLPHWQTLRPWHRCKDTLAKCVRVGGYAVSMGFGSRCRFGDRRGFKTLAIYNIEPAGKEDRYNIQLVVEEKTQTALSDYVSKKKNFSSEPNKK